MEKNIRNQLCLPNPSQVCIVVRDLKETASYYEKFFAIGPFVFPEIHYKQITYHGRAADGYWEMAFARMGSVELELACPVKSPSIYEDFLNEKGEGLHHFGFDVQNMDKIINDAAALGIKVLMSGRTDRGGFAHLDTTQYGGTIFEIIQRQAPRV